MEKKTGTWDVVNRLTIPTTSYHHVWKSRRKNKRSLESKRKKDRFQLQYKQLKIQTVWNQQNNERENW
jgi:hypothetical protein